MRSPVRLAAAGLVSVVPGTARRAAARIPALATTRTLTRAAGRTAVAAARPVTVAALAALALVVLGGPATAKDADSSEQEAAETARRELKAGRLCPDGLGQLASWEPIEIAGSKATVAFALAAGCRNIDVSLISYEVSSGRGSPTALVLDTAAGTFSSGQLGRLDVLVASDCAFRVALLVGKPARMVEATAQNPDACMFGAPIVATAGNRTPDGATRTAKPAPAAAGPEIPPATTAAKPKATRPEPKPAARPRAAAGDEPAPAKRQPATQAPGRPAGTTRPAATPEPARPLAAEPAAVHRPGPLSVDRAMTEGWDLSSLLALAATALACGIMLLRAARHRDRIG